MNLIIAGSRDLDDLELVQRWTENVSRICAINCVLCGGARGADALGKQVAEAAGIAVKMFPAEWDKYGRGAGYRRNIDMAREGTFLLAFPMPNSKGTLHIIETMQEMNKPVLIIGTGY